MLIQAEILREWNQLDEAFSLAEEALSLCQQSKTIISLILLLYAYTVLLRISLSHGELDAACYALQKFECIGTNMNPHIYLHTYSLFTVIDQIRLWLARGELKLAERWSEELQGEERYSSPLACERKEVACVRVLLATAQPNIALQRLKPVLQRATQGQRWGHVLEIYFLQALAYQILLQETQALNALSEAVRLAEPENYIRSFVDEGAPMETLLYRLRKRNRKQGPTPYLDTLLAAFQHERLEHAREKERMKIQALPEPLSERELQVLQLLAHGASNLEIAQDLVIVVDTVKRHISNIFAKLGAQNRFQAAREAQALGLLDEKL